jgi:hypothetical protein
MPTKRSKDELENFNAIQQWLLMQGLAVGKEGGNDDETMNPEWRQGWRYGRRVWCQKNGFAFNDTPKPRFIILSRELRQRIREGRRNAA